VHCDPGGPPEGGQRNSSTHWWLDSTYWPPTLVPSGQTRARSGSPSKEQSGSPGPPLLELLLGGPPLDPLEDPLLEPEPPELEGHEHPAQQPPELETPELETPELETPLLEDPLLEPPVLGGSLPTLGSTRPMQPAIDRLANSTGATQCERRKENAIPVTSAACVPERNPTKSDELRGSR
jgi:hypothetical protein